MHLIKNDYFNTFRYTILIVIYNIEFFVAYLVKNQI